jgi:hypothetical protein
LFLVSGKLSFIYSIIHSVNIGQGLAVC